MNHPDKRTALRTDSRFYAGKPCLHGHGTTRYVHNSACIECERIAGAARKQANADAERERKAQWKRDNPERTTAQRQRHNARHAQAKAVATRDWQMRDPNGAYAARMERNRIIREQIATDKRAERAKRIAHAASVNAERLRLIGLAKHAEAMLRASSEDGTAMSMRALYQRVKRGRNRALKFGCRSDLETWQLAAVGDAQGWRCAYCGTNRNLDLDHMTPLSLNGAHSVGNMQWLCKFHNADKRDIPDADYRRLRGIACCTPWDVI